MKSLNKQILPQNILVVQVQHVFTYLFKMMNCQPYFTLSIEHTTQVTPSYSKVWLGFNGLQITSLKIWKKSFNIKYFLQSLIIAMCHALLRSYALRLVHLELLTEEPRYSVLHVLFNHTFL